MSLYRNSAISIHAKSPKERIDINKDLKDIENEIRKIVDEINIDEIIEELMKAKKEIFLWDLPVKVPLELGPPTKLIPLPKK